MRANWVATPTFAMKSSEHPAPHPTNVLLCSSLLASQLCGGQTSRKTHLLYPVLSIKYPCSLINIYMDSNKTIVHSTVESTQVTSGHSCPLHNLQIILCNTVKGSITFPSPVHLSIFLHSSPGSKVVVTSCQPDADRFMDQTLTIGSWQIWDTIRVYWVLMSDLCTLSECTFYIFLCTSSNFLSFHGKKLQWVYSMQAVPYHPTCWWFAPLVCWLKWHTFYPFWCHIPQGILFNSILRATEGKCLWCMKHAFWCTFLYSNMDGQFAKWRLFPTCQVRVSRF